MAFLKTILIVLLVYYLLKMVLRMFAPQIMGYAAKKTEQHFKERFGEFNASQRSQEQKQDEVIIEKKNTGKTGSNEKVGEYIDFEEID